MAKKSGNNNEGQMNLFPFNPAIKNFGITSAALGTGIVKGDFVAATEANDLSMLTPERWAEAHAEQLVKLLGGDLNAITGKMEAAYEAFWAERRARDADAKLGYAKLPDAELEALREARSVLLVRMTGHGFTLPVAALAKWGQEQIEQASEWLDAIDDWKAGGAAGQPPAMPEFILANAGWLNATADTAANDHQADVEARGGDLAAETGQGEGGGEEAPGNAPEGQIPKAGKRAGRNGKGNGAGASA